MESATTQFDPEAAAESPGAKKKTILSVVITVLTGLILAVATATGLISATIALIIFALICVAMVIFHGGGSEMVSGLSDAEGYERELEEEEQRKAQEAEESGEESSEHQ